jgi:DNA-binding transcriptional LysR family regulator
MSAAADLVGVTPPVVTLQLQLLEDRIELVLLERTRSDMVLTDAGQILIDTAHRVGAELRALAEIIGDHTYVVISGATVINSCCRC